MKVGSLVKCVHQFTTPLTSYELKAGVILPEKNKDYTVREIYQGDARDGSGTGYFIRLEEIKNPNLPYLNGHGEIGFCITRFRELLPPEEIAEAMEEVKEILEPALA